MVRTVRSLFLRAALVLGVLSTSCATPATLQPGAELITRTALLRVSDNGGQDAAQGLRIMSLNMAHGRGLAFHQALLGRTTTQANLDKIAQLIEREHPDVLALQEADGPSSWSGGFDHLMFLQDKIGFADNFLGHHTNKVFGGEQLLSGTALLSKRALEEPRSVEFDRNWRDNKGFVVARTSMPGANTGAATVVSVHLDFLSDDLRRQQIAHMKRELADLPRPMIIAGDLNCEWDDGEGCVAELSEALGLQAVAPTAQAPTYPSESPGRRLDWILHSPDLQVRSYRVLEDPVSDHRAVIAQLHLSAASHTGVRATHQRAQPTAPPRDGG